MKNLLLEEDLEIKHLPNNARYTEAIYSRSGAVVFKSTNDRSKQVSEDELKILLG